MVKPNSVWPPEVTSARDAFTAIELLVALVIGAILLALLIPALSTAKSRSRTTQCANHLRQMGLALQMYIDDHQGRCPYLRSLPDSGATGPVDDDSKRWWFAKILAYDPAHAQWMDPSYHCPGYKGAITGVRDNHDPLGSYAYNDRGVRPPFAGYRDPLRGIDIRFPTNSALGLGPTLYLTVPGGRAPTQEPRIAAPSEMFAIGESRFLNSTINDHPGGQCDMLCGGLTRPRWNGFAFDPARHGKNYNQLFCDGHVSAMSPWVLFDPGKTAAMWNYDHEPHPELWLPDY